MGRKEHGHADGPGSVVGQQRLQQRVKAKGPEGSQVHGGLMGKGVLDALHILLHGRYIEAGRRQAAAEGEAELLPVFNLDTLEHGGLRGGIGIEHSR